MLELIGAPDFDQKFVYKKYANKSAFRSFPFLRVHFRQTLMGCAEFLKASIFARNWTQANANAVNSGDATASKESQ